MLTRPIAIVVAAGVLLAGPVMAQNKAEKPADGTTQPSKIDAAAGIKGLKTPKTLKVGDPAPGIAVDKWVKGEGLDTLEPGRVYVVEFWATWCPPCIKSIPHLTELQHKHKDVVFIGMASSDGDGSKGETTVRNFVAKQGKKMDYRVAFDGKGKMAQAYMAPAGQNGIPCSFVIDGQGKVAFIGHPMEPGFETAIEKASKDASVSAEKAKSPEAKPDPKTKPAKDAKPGEDDKKK